MTPIAALERAIARGGHPSLISSRRHRRFEGRPGEIIERMDVETRAALRCLRSEDVGAGAVSRYAGWLSTDDDFFFARLAYKNATRDFDRHVLHLRPGPRAQRRVHRWPS